MANLDQTDKQTQQGGTTPVQTKLSDSHLQELRDSGISPEIMAAAELFSASDRGQICKSLGRFDLKPEHLPALGIPYYLPGQQDDVQVRFKPQVPVKGRDGKSAKYLSAAGGSTHLYFPPSMRGDSVRNDVSIPLIIVEGEKKALCAESNGFASVAIAGVTCWNHPGTKELHEDFCYIGLEGRLIYISFDSDAQSNAIVSSQEKRLARALVTSGATVRLVRIPPETNSKVGLDDYIVRYGKKAFETLLHRSLVPRTKSYALSDLGNAERFVEDHGIALAYVSDWERPIVFDNKRWIKNSEISNQRKMFGTVRRIAEEAAELESEEKRKAVSKWAEQSESLSRIMGAITLSRGLVKQLSSADLDCNPLHLNCKNGTIDLKTSELKPHDPEDYITQLSPVEYDPNARSLAFGRFLLQIMDGNKYFVKALQRIAGYCLTGSIKEHALFMLWGEGGNGKGTFLGLLRDVLGLDYAGEAMGDMLLEKRYDSHPTELANLFGKRCVTASEANRGRHLNEALVKRLTGGDQITARRMREDPWTFEPTHKIMYMVNDKPEIQGTDAGIWRRIFLIPFTVKFEGKKLDRDLPDRLRASALPAILAWAVRGCIEWQRHGLSMPEQWRAATDDYKADSDALGRFIDDECIKGKTERIAFAELYDAYEKWCHLEGCELRNKTDFARDLQSKGFVSVKSGNVRLRQGLRLRNSGDIFGNS
ncbi:MAG: DUF3854 domain-containing protein [Spirochaetia bacterium]|nr:DUF3854 domain-containing protein [Spirochaetia bacterium]